MTQPVKQPGGPRNLWSSLFEVESYFALSYFAGADDVRKPSLQADTESDSNGISPSVEALRRSDPASLRAAL